MPNYITNILHINGPRNDINQIIGLSNDSNDFSFAFVVPYPPEAKNDKNFNWNVWQTENWGTKWDAGDTTFVSNELEDDFAEINFETAWTPPEAWLKAAIEKFPNTDFKLYWLDEDYPCSGQILGSNSQITKNEYYGNNKDAAKEFVKEYFTDIYEMNEKEYRLQYLSEEINEVIHEFFPNANIEITREFFNNDTEQYEPIEFKLEYCDEDSDTDIFLSLNIDLQKKIIKSVKKIILEHGYPTTVKEQSFIVKK